MMICGTCKIPFKPLSISYHEGNIGEGLYICPECRHTIRILAEAKTLKSIAIQD